MHNGGRPIGSPPALFLFFSQGGYSTPNELRILSKSAMVWT